ncbi:MAG TPA: murein L,D-transpeptidase catalytic domain family protein [Sphingomonas sp.]|nr:murein L,D-transpeptidase catalytic domain family protein [Sphingomonas sp.]
MIDRLFTRRGLLAAAAMTAGGLAFPGAAAIEGRPGPITPARAPHPGSSNGPPSPESDLVAHARKALARHGATISHDDVVGLADFSPASKTARLHLVDMRKGTHTSLLVAHGRGSDPSHSGFLHRFSNEEGSNCTSEGAYRTSDLYVGAHGRSMRLDGLEATNDNARARAIVVHGAWYVSDEMVRDHGMLGRSEGCFAVAENQLDDVLERLGPGRLLVAGKFSG